MQAETNASLFLAAVDMIYNVDVDHDAPAVCSMLRHISESGMPTGFLDETDYGNVKLVLDQVQNPVVGIADLGVTRYSTCNINILKKGLVSERDKSTWSRCNRRMLPKLNERICEIVGLDGDGHVITSGPDIHVPHDTSPPMLKLILFTNGWVCVVAVPKAA